MAYISHKKHWESEFDGIVSKRDELQNLNTIPLKLEVYDTFEKNEKMTTNFETIDDPDVINKSYLDEKLKKKMDIFFILKTITTNLNYNTTNNLKKTLYFKEP